MNFIKKIHISIKLLKTKLKGIFLNLKLKKNSTIFNYHYHYDEGNLENLFNKLCILHGTDKGFLKSTATKLLKPHELKPHTYSTIYHNLFSHCRESINLVFELGIGSNNINITSNMTSNGKPGASLRVFRDYFPKAEIYGGDIDNKILFQEERIFTFEVDQLSSLSIEKMWSNINKSNFDLIVDDGLHTCEATFNLFKNSFKKLRNGGIYIIEDVHYSYIKNLANKLKKYNPEIIISKSEYFNKYNIKNNNLILIRKM
jgi:hypothetical protein